MAANYSMSSAPGQACVWRDRPHFRKAWRRKRRRIGGRERKKNVNPPPPHPPHHENVLIRRPGTPSSCQMKMVPSEATKCLCRMCLHFCKWGIDGPVWRMGSATVLARRRERDYESAAQATVERGGLFN